MLLLVNAIYVDDTGSQVLLASYSLVLSFVKQLSHSLSHIRFEMALSGVLSFFTFFTFFSIAFAFTHPGLLVTDQDLSRAKQKIANQQDPWLSSWNKLTSLTYSSADYTNNAVSTVSRINLDSDVSNADLLWHDAAAAFNLAIRWKISGDDSYAATAAAILTAWGDKLERLGGGDEAYLLAGLQGYEMANAGELLRDYAPFQKAGLSTFTTMMTTVFLPMNIDFLNHVLGSEHNVKHFFANWELANVASAMAIAVLADNQTAWDFAVDYFKTGSGNGAINNAVTNVVEEPDTGRPLGQGQESGRDQGHSALDFQLLGAIGQQAWNQGEDLFAYNQSRLLLGSVSNMSLLASPMLTSCIEPNTLLVIIWAMMFRSSLTPMVSSVTPTSAQHLAGQFGQHGNCCTTIMSRLKARRLHGPRHI